jgi:hypothetical protein
VCGPQRPVEHRCGWRRRRAGLRWQRRADTCGGGEGLSGDTEATGYVVALTEGAGHGYRVRCGAMGLRAGRLAGLREAAGHGGGCA